MTDNIRVAFFPDSYLEVNGAAMTCQRLVRYAKRKGYPYLCVHAGPESGSYVDESVTYLTLKRSPLSFSLDEGLAYDPFFQRYVRRVQRAIVAFRPDVIHITGLNDVSIIGSYLAWKLQIPMVGSWHTNIHEFAASRLEKLFHFLPRSASKSIAKLAEKKIMKGAVLYYRMPKVILSPNQELVDELGRRTKRVSRLMGRGVDPEKFSPAKRTVNDGTIRIGFVGRLRAEKNVRLLVDIERGLLDAGMTNFKFLIVGEGSEREYLEQAMKTAEFTGFLEGEQLAEAYANMDIFVFPSETDAFGNVTQEATVSGVPAIVSHRGGPKFLVVPGESGYVAENDDDYVKYALDLMRDPEKLAGMKIKSREYAKSRSWDSIFEGVFDAYHEAVRINEDLIAAAKN